MRRKFVTGILKLYDAPWQGCDVEFLFKTPVYLKSAKDYLASMCFGVENAIKIFGAERVSRVLEGESIKTRVKVDKIFSKEELDDIVFVERKR